MRSLLVACIELYRLLLSPVLGPRCRFHPTCSTYAKEALEQKGIILGSFYIAVRLLKCHPLHPGGYDPVSDSERSSGSDSSVLEKKGGQEQKKKNRDGKTGHIGINFGTPS